MSDTPTPETDAFILSAPANFITRTMWTDHARRLERERDALREELKAEVARLKKDSERLDWLLSRMDGGFLPANNCVAWHITHYNYGNRYPSRSAIDEALAAVRGEEEGK
jgi:hypothetical protein